MTVGAWIQCATAGRSIMLLLNIVREWEKTFGVLCFQSIYSTFPLGCSKPKLCFSSNSSHHMDQRKNNSLQLEGLWWGKTSNHTPVLWEESTVQSIKSMQQISKYPLLVKQTNQYFPHKLCWLYSRGDVKAMESVTRKVFWSQRISRRGFVMNGCLWFYLAVEKQLGRRGEKKEIFPQTI